MTKVLISGIIGLIISFSSFNGYIAKFFKVKENILVSSSDEESMVTEKNFDIDVKVRDEIVENTEPVVVEAKEESSQQKQEEIKQPEVINNTTTQQQNNVKTSSVENKIIKTESQPTTTQKQETKVENKTATTNTNTTKTNTNTTNTNNANNKTTNNNQQTSTQSVNTQIQVQQQSQPQKQQAETQPQVKQEEQKQVQEVVPAQPIREVRRNDEMIQKIKTYISTHESERMKKYGYSFVVDPNVVKRTNAFTFSEFNMQSCLDLTGEIVIYAQDYYCNGQYVETQCFVY